MMPKQDILPFLTDDAGNSFRVQNGVVNTTSTPTPIIQSTDGWQDTQVKWERNADYRGVFRSFTTSLKFVRDALKILRSKLYAFGPEYKFYLILLFLDKSYGGGWVHRQFYKGELDLSQTKDADKVYAVNIMEGDLVKYLKAKQNQTYEIPITGPTVRMDGLELNNSSSYTSIEASQGVAASLSVNYSVLWLPLLFLNNSGTNIDAEQQNTDIVGNEVISIGPYADASKPDNWFYKTDVARTVQIKFDVSMQIFEGQTLELYFKNSNGTRTSLHTITNPFPAALFHQTDQVHVDVSLNLNAGEKLFLLSQLRIDSFHAHSAGGAYGVIENLEIITKSKYRTTYTKTMRPVDIGQALLDKMTGGGYIFSSNYLSHEWENLVITSGDGLRSLDGAVIKTSFTDFFSSYHVPCNLACFVNGRTISVEPHAQAYDQTVAMPLGSVKDFEKSIAVDHQFTGVKIGYEVSENTTYESLNGRGAFNAISEYTSVVTRSSKVLELVSKYKAACGEIELIRVNLDGKTTTDSSTDNDVYFLHIDKTSAGTLADGTPYYNLYRQVYDSVTGLISPSTAFNIELSPARCMRRHGNYLRSAFYWLESTKFVFQTSNKNTELTTVKNGVTIQENADIVIGTLDPPLFIPLLLNFQSPVPKDIVNVMRNNPNQSFSFQWYGDTFYGFPQSIGIKPANQPVQESTLLCSPLTDITKFMS